MDNFKESIYLEKKKQPNRLPLAFQYLKVF